MSIYAYVSVDTYIWALAAPVSIDIFVKCVIKSCTSSEVLKRRASSTLHCVYIALKYAY